MDNPQQPNQAPQPAPPPQQPAPKVPYGKGYGKRPLWHWIVIYLVIGGILYYGVYYFAYSRKGGSTNTTNTSSSPY